MTAGSGNPRKPSSQARSRARRLAMQALYQWDMAGANLGDIDSQFRDSEEFQKLDVEYFEELLHQVPARLDEIEAGLAPGLSLPIADLDPVERAILRLAGYELALRPDIPYKVVINEAVNLAKKFGAEQAHTFINGALDAAAKTLRAVEHPHGNGDNVWGKGGKS